MTGACEPEHDGGLSTSTSTTARVRERACLAVRSSPARWPPRSPLSAQSSAEAPSAPKHVRACGDRTTDLEHAHGSTAQLHALFRPPVAVDDAVVFSVKDELHEGIQRRRRLQAIPLFPIGVRNGHVRRYYHLRQWQRRQVGWDQPQGLSHPLSEMTLHYQSCSPRGKGRRTCVLMFVGAFDDRPSSIRHRVHAIESPSGGCTPRSQLK